jgi:hypothetical protein
MRGVLHDTILPAALMTRFANDLAASGSMTNDRHARSASLMAVGRSH